MSAEYCPVQCVLCGKSVDSHESASLGEKLHLWNLIPPHVQVARKGLQLTERYVCGYCYEKLEDWYSFINQLVVGTQEVETHSLNADSLQPQPNKEQALAAESLETIPSFNQKRHRGEKGQSEEELKTVAIDISGLLSSHDEAYKQTLNKGPTSGNRAFSSPCLSMPACSRAKQHSEKTYDASKEELPSELLRTIDSSNKPVKQSRFTLDYLRERLNRPFTEEEEKKLKELIAKGDDRGIYNYLLGGGSKQVWDCQICNLSVQGGMTDVVNHYAQEHNSKPIFICKLCGKKITSIHTFIRHRQSHLVEVKCPICGKIFADRSKLYMHKPMHSEKRPYVCSECGRGYKMLSHLKNHQERAHVPQDQKASFTCEFCGKIFAVRSNLSTHISQTHNQNRQFVCDICGKVLKAKQALECHLKSHAGIKPFQCHMCDDKFSSKASLSAHVRIHTGEKPFTCKECGKSFTNRSARNSHMQFVHSNERKFVCEVCGKGFKVQRDLKVHGSVHTGEKPFVCTCGKTFRAGANYYAHRRIHKKESDNKPNSVSLPEKSGCVQPPEDLVARDEDIISNDLSTTVPTGVNDTIAHAYHNLPTTVIESTGTSDCMFVPYAVLQTATPNLTIVGYSTS